MFCGLQNVNLNFHRHCREWIMSYDFHFRVNCSFKRNKSQTVEDPALKMSANVFPFQKNVTAFLRWKNLDVEEAQWDLLRGAYQRLVAASVTEGFKSCSHCLMFPNKLQYSLSSADEGGLTTKIKINQDLWIRSIDTGRNYISAYLKIEFWTSSMSSSFQSCKLLP